MKRILTRTITAAALTGAAWTTPALADGARHPARQPLAEAPVQLTSRRPVEALDCGLLAIGRARPRTAPVVDADPLLAVQGEAVDRSRRIRALTASIERELELLDGRVVTVSRPAPPVTVARAPVAVDGALLAASRAARAVGPLTIDAATLRKSRLARALAAR